MAVQRVDASSTNCVYFTGVTTTSDTPQTAPHQWQYVFTPAAASPYTVNIAQTLNGNHTLFYNQAGDSSGIDQCQLAAVDRTPHGASAVRGTETMRGIQHFTGAGDRPRSAARPLPRQRGADALARAQIELAEGAYPGPELTIGKRGVRALRLHPRGHGRGGVCSEAACAA